MIRELIADLRDLLIAACVLVALGEELRRDRQSEDQR